MSPILRFGLSKLKIRSQTLRALKKYQRQEAA
jgi:hypothetical protein